MAVEAQSLLRVIASTCHAASGCQQAYGRIVMACQNTVAASALAITRDIAASEDIAQEAFLRAWQRLAQLHQPASFLPWLRQITRNLARNWLRANRHRALSGEAAELAIAMAADPAPSPTDHLLQAGEEIAAFDITPRYRKKVARRCCCITAKARARNRLRRCWA